MDGPKFSREIPGNPLKVGTPRLPYYSHKNPLKYGNGMGPAKWEGGKSYPGEIPKIFLRFLVWSDLLHCLEISNMSMSPLEQVAEKLADLFWLESEYHETYWEWMFPTGLTTKP